MNAKESLRQEIRRLYSAGLELGDISERTRTDVSKIREILNQESDRIHKRKKDLNFGSDDVEDFLEGDLTIKTKKSLAKLYSNAWRLFNEAMNNGAYSIALQTMNTLVRQIQLTMQSLGELSPNKDQGKAIPKDFIEYLVKQMEDEGLFKEDALNDEKKSNNERKKEIDNQLY